MTTPLVTTYNQPHICIVPHGLDGRRMFSLFHGKQTNHVRVLIALTRYIYLTPPSPCPLHRSKWKYKLTSIFLAVLTLYMLVCSVVCALAVASQGGGSTMLLSLLVTYGGKLCNLT